MKMLLPTTLDSLLPHRNFLLQFFKPVQHDVDLRRRRLHLLDGPEHQEALAVEGHVVVGGSCRDWQVQSLEEHPGLARSETSLCGDVHGHHLVATWVRRDGTWRMALIYQTTIQCAVPLVPPNA
jgi:hypothetical protein